MDNNELCFWHDLILKNKDAYLLKTFHGHLR